MRVKIFEISIHVLIHRVSCLLCYDDFVDLWNNVNCKQKIQLKQNLSL